MNQLKVQNLYNTLLTQDGGIPPSGDCDFTVATAPTRTYGYIILSPDNALQMEIMYYHNVVGNRIYVRGVNRINPKEHSEGEVVKMNDVAEIFNTFSDMIAQTFYIEKTGPLTVKVWGGYVSYNGVPVLVADTTLTLTDNATNYIKYSFDTNTITVDTTNSGNIKAIVVTLSGSISTVEQRTTKESMIDPSLVLLSGSGAPSDSLGTDGTVYIDATNGDFYKKIAGAFVLQGSIQGPQGPQGDPGDMDSSVYDPANGARQVAFSDEVVKTTGNQTISDVKTFSSSPIVPTPTTGTQASNKDYSDSLNPDFYQYSIVRTVASGNLTVALKNYEGNDPTPTKPVKIMIGGVVRTITGPLEVSGVAAGNSGTNYLNLGSAELATKEADLFVYLGWSISGSVANMFLSRIPTALLYEDFNASNSNEKGRIRSLNVTPANGDPVVNIGRFNATLSAGAGYTWSIPATSVIVNSPIYETRWLDYLPTLYGNGGSIGTMACSPYEGKYKVSGDALHFVNRIKCTNVGSWSSTVIVKLPFSITTELDEVPVTGYIGAVGSITSRGVPVVDTSIGAIFFITGFDTANLAWGTFVVNDIIRCRGTLRV